MLHTQVPGKAERDHLNIVKGMADGQSARKAMSVLRELAPVPVNLGQLLQPPCSKYTRAKPAAGTEALPPAKVSMHCCLHS